MIIHEQNFQLQLYRSDLLYQFLLLDSYELDEKYIIQGEASKNGVSRLFMVECNKSLELLDIANFSSFLFAFGLTKTERINFKSALQEFILEQWDEVVFDSY